MRHRRNGTALAIGAWAILASTAWADSVYELNDRAALDAYVSAAEKTPPVDATGWTYLGVAYHNLGIIHVGGAPEKAVDALKRATELAPGSCVAEAYLGSAKTMVARDSWNIIVKVSSVNRGAAMIDKAVRCAPDDPVVRLVRANNSLALPAFFKRRHYAYDDFAWLVDAAAAGKVSLTPRRLAEIHYRLGLLYREDGVADRAKHHFAEARAVAPGSEWAVKAAEEEA
jgi:tetratricopeptide (TPR) repeat protein